MVSVELKKLIYYYIIFYYSHLGGNVWLWSISLNAWEEHNEGTKIKKIKKIHCGKLTWDRTERRVLTGDKLAQHRCRQKVYTPVAKLEMNTYRKADDVLSPFLPGSTMHFFTPRNNRIYYAANKGMEMESRMGGNSLKLTPKFNICSAYILLCCLLYLQCNTRA